MSYFLGIWFEVMTAICILVGRASTFDSGHFSDFLKQQKLWVGKRLYA